MIAICLIVPSLLYVGLELDVVQRQVTSRAENELSRLLGADVKITSVSIAPFNRAWLRGITISLPDSLAVSPAAAADTVAEIQRIGAGIDLTRLLRGDIVIGYAELIGADIRLKRDSAHAPLNIEPIIRALSPRDTLKPKSRYDLQIRSVVLRRTRLAYDILSEPLDTSRFDRNHIELNDLRADIRIPRLSNDTISVAIDRFALNERSGLAISNLTLQADITPGRIVVDNPTIELPHSKIAISTIDFPLPTGELDPAAAKRRLRSAPINLHISEGSYLTPSDLQGFVPLLAPLTDPLNLHLAAQGSLDNLEVDQLLAFSNNPQFRVEVANCLIDSMLQPTTALGVDLGRLEVYAATPRFVELITRAGDELPTKITDKALTLIANAEFLRLRCHGHLSGGRASLSGDIATRAGTISLDATSRPFAPSMPIEATISTADLNPQSLLAGVAPQAGLFGPLTFNLDASANLKPEPWGEALLSIEKLTYRGNQIEDITLDASLSEQRQFEVDLLANDPRARFNAHGSYSSINRIVHEATAEIDIDNLDFSLLSPCPSGERTLRLHADADFTGTSIDDCIGQANINRIHLTNGERKSDIGSINLEVNGTSMPKYIELRSDMLNANVNGFYRLPHLAADAKEIAFTLLPALAPAGWTPRSSDYLTHNDFDFDMTIRSTKPIAALTKLPVEVLTDVTIEGSFNAESHTFALNINAPYLQQGYKIIEKSSVLATVTSDSINGTSGSLYLTSLIPAKSGKINLESSMSAFNNYIDTEVKWTMDRERDFSGRIDLSARLSRDEATRGLLSDIHINRSKLTFNDTAWTVNPSDIHVQPGRISVDGFKVTGFNGQHVSINGTASASPDDSIHLALDRMDLDYVFETLEISNAMFGGRASGNFYASALLSPEPRLQTNDLTVEGIKYNHCLMGDAVISSRWDAANKGVVIDADIVGDHDNHSYIDGIIKPLSEELDFRFTADDVPVGFLLPFMEAFTSAIDGRASGNAHLYGTFKLLDMTGDLYANNFKMKVDFTNCWYQTTDSIHLRPGRIEIPGITLRDMEGHTANFSGVVTHRCFKEPTFDFHITNARDLLVYDVGKSPDYNWYGHIYGDGSAAIKGVPGRIDINVDMSTAPRSTFTFELSDAEEAYDYTFINFRDRNATIDEVVDLEIPEPVRELKRRLASSPEESSPTAYNLTITMDVSPNTDVTLVMDPVGGDKIDTHGSGRLTMKYLSTDESLDIRGDYTLVDGHYNFTLQDIIIKDFTIKEGSKIAFFGDPYNARLDMQAIYHLNANLTDLDESFSQDKEISRTNVPIEAILKVSGEISQPEIKFDLRFPSLTEDTYRKVRSIISTEDMMNRQIIYLLALSRFYTPEYMTATKGNELVSVASSTISSQLSNILGQLSDNWTIAPNFRSDRGDFSDVEFDLALSSRLLNNRLLLNGNFGYRDKALNNNSFIGDFDLEYLLNRSGSLRLKAYNRYNDRNFYVKSALTTQGVGVMYRRDFDNLFGLFHRQPRPKVTEQKPDSAATAAPDTTATIRSIPLTPEPTTEKK